MKNKKFKKQIIPIAVLILVLTSLLVFSRKIGLEKEKALNGEIINTIAKIEMLKKYNSMTPPNDNDYIYLFYKINDTVIHHIKSIHHGDIERLSLKVGDIYTIEVAKSDINYFKLDLDKKNRQIDIDTNNLNHIYQTERHKKNILKGKIKAQ